MFIAALSTIAKIWKEPRCLLTDEWIKKMWYIYIMEYYSATRKDDYPPFAWTWMELRGIMLSEISQAKKDNYHMVSLICGILGIAGRMTGEGREKMRRNQRGRQSMRDWILGNKLRVTEGRGVGGWHNGY